MEVLAAFQPSALAYATVAGDGVADGERFAARLTRRRGRATVFAWLLAIAATRGTGLVLALVFLAAVGLYGAVLGGQYAAFTAAEGTLPDLLARSIGFGIKSVTISGAHELSNAEILATAGIEPTRSLLFLNAAKLRARLMSLPLVENASVSKLYPDHLLIQIVERKPIALWQEHDEVKVIAADGMPIDTLRDKRFLSLPLTVGVGANKHIDDYLAILDAAGPIRSRIAAGIFVAQRHWILKMRNGIEVALPEKGAITAVRELVRLERNDFVLDKDIVGLDLRIPGRLIVTLPAAVAHARMEMLAHRRNAKGARR